MRDSNWLWLLRFSEHRICRFGLYEADLDSGNAERHGIPVSCKSMPFRILTFLLNDPATLSAAKS
jgi:hypothetical protein